MQHPECWPILDNPYTEFYDYSCDKANKKITCGSEYTTDQEGEILLTCSFDYALVIVTGEFICVLSAVSSSGKNNECEMFICQCDKAAAECFGRSPWNPEHEHLPSDRCQ